MDVDGCNEQDLNSPHRNGCTVEAKDTGKGPKSYCGSKDASSVGPDGRLSWAIAITCFVINLIGACFFRCPGMFFNSLMDTFDASRGDASVPVSLYGGFYNMAGLVAGALIGSFGVRLTLILGGVMMAVGFGVSLFATSTLFLVFTVGVLAGAGNGVVFSSSIVAVTSYFDKRRGIALGLNMAGPSMTSLVVPMLLQWLLKEYGLRGTFLLLGGCMANIPVLGILLRNPPWEKTTRETTAVEVENCFNEVAKGDVQPASLVPRNNGEPCDRLTMEVCHSSASGKRRSTAISITNHNGVSRNTTIIPSRVPAAKGTASSVNATRRFSVKPWLLVPDHRPSIASRRSTFASSAIGEAANRRVPSIASTISPRNAALERRGTMMSVAGSMFASRRASSNDAFSRRGTVISAIGFPAPVDMQKTVEAPSSALSSLKEVLCAPRMYFHTFSFFTCAFFVDSYLTVMFDLGEDIGVSYSESLLALLLFSAMDTVGRLFVPFLTDYGVTSTASLLTLCYITLAVISALMPCVSERLAFLAVSALLGLPGGYVLVGTSETLSKELGTKNLPMAYGVLAFITALGGFARPPVVGAFRDGLGSYDGLFQLMAGMLLIAFLFNVGLWINGRSSAKKDVTKALALDNTMLAISEPLPALIEEDQCTSL
ncbi:uncharacterized protein LOC142574301 [Dermacentor variabilis]|uniref:uncharacterized protein LOC142574301 n=1 Tax=Dermacentor variabilis TaxID=34621 RepID=UPI003F5B4E73